MRKRHDESPTAASGIGSDTGSGAGSGTAAPPPPAWFAALQGRWRLRRRVIGLPLQFQARLEGVVTLTPAVAMLSQDATLAMSGATGGDLLYEETGALRLRDGMVLQAKRRYLYRYEKGSPGNSEHVVVGKRGETTPVTNAVTGTETGAETSVETGVGKRALTIALAIATTSEIRAGDGAETGRAADERSEATDVASDLTCLQILFADGPQCGQPYVRLFVPASLTSERRTLLSGGSEDQHLCGADLYRVHYRFDEDAGRIVQRTIVTGPRKHYAIVSILDRMVREGV